MAQWLRIRLPMQGTRVVFFFFLNILFIYLFIYLWLCWVFVSVRGLSPVAASGGHSSSQCAGLSLCGPLTITASLVAEHRLQTRRLSNCGSRAQSLRGMWDPPRPGLEPGDTGLSPGPGRSQMPRSILASAPQLLRPHATTTEARVPRAHALQQEKPPQ